MAQELFNSQDWISAADRGDADTVERFLAEGADVDVCTPGSETALMRAAARGHAPLVRVLLTRGADPNLSRRDGWTALMLAAFFGHAETARELLRRGADIEATDRNGSTASKWATSRGHLEVARLINDASAAGVSIEKEIEKVAPVVETGKDAKADTLRPIAPTPERAPEINAAVTPPILTPTSAARRVEPAGDAREELDEVTIATAVRKSSAAPAAPTHAPTPAQVFMQAHAPAPIPAHTHAPPAASIFERADELRAEMLAVSPEVRREVNELAARAARRADGGARFWRSAALGMALLAVGAALLAYKFGGAGAPSAGDGARFAATPEASAQPATAAPIEMQPAVPVTPIASPLPADPASQGVGTVGLAPGTQPSVPTYFPPATTDAATTVETARPRETYPANQPAGRASGGDPALVNLGQSERTADDAPALPTRRPQDSAASDNTRTEAPATRPARDDSAQRSTRTTRPADEPRPTPTPKGKVVNWP
ncbi:MAG TPA: ankyrin repeat domain-containing protein [Pyrinomonadaceae bacterium]